MFEEIGIYCILANGVFSLYKKFKSCFAQIKKVLKYDWNQLFFMKRELVQFTNLLLCRIKTQSSSSPIAGHSPDPRDHLPGFAYTLNLVAHNAINTFINKAVEVIKRVVMIFKRSTFVLKKLNKTRHSLNKGKLKEDAPSVWKYTYIFKRLFVNKEAIISTLVTNRKIFQ